MSSVNLHTREVSIKIVYYGPGLGGKTTSLQYLHRALKPDSRGQLVSLATGVDRTLFFDFLPVKLPKVRGFSVRVQLYTVPGQVHYNSTRKLVLTGADGVVFVADSQRDRLTANVESAQDLGDNLSEQGLSIRTIPLVIQWNKRDAPGAVAVPELEAALPNLKSPTFETIATKGVGVFEALKKITTLVLADLRRKGALGEVPPAGSTTTTSDIAALPSADRSKPIPLAPSLSAAAGGTVAAASGSAASTAIGAFATAGTTPGLSASGSPETTVTLGSLSEVADAIDRMSPALSRTTSGLHRLPTTGSPARALSELVIPGSARDAIAALEADVERGEWATAVRRAGKEFRELASRLSGALAGDHGAEATALAALLTGLPAVRFLRFREAEERVRSAGAVTSADALFALFFLVDFALRAEEIRKV
ncbi:MAG: GTPase domain-containing protein [Pseudomonadota bacterium]